jgi:hypothetical protein
VQALQFFSHEAQVFVCVQETNSSFSNYLVISSSVCLCPWNAVFSWLAQVFVCVQEVPFFLD